MVLTVTPLELDRELGDFVRLHRQVMKRVFTDCGLFNGHPFLLFLIRREPGITPAKLARETDLPPAAVTISAKRLEAAGLIRREPDGRDRRVVHLTLTPEGERLDDRCRKGRDRMAEALFSGFSPEERARFSEMLARMRDNLAETDPAGWQNEGEETPT